MEKVMVVHVIWFAPTPAGGPMKVTVEAYDNARCVSLAQLMWDSLSNAGYHMMNRRP